MKLKRLKKQIDKLIAKYGDTAEILLASDMEGNRHYKLTSINSDAFIRSNEHFTEDVELFDEEEVKNESTEPTCCNFKRVIILYP